MNANVGFGHRAGAGSPQDFREDFRRQYYFPFALHGRHRKWSRWLSTSSATVGVAGGLLAVSWLRAEEETHRVTPQHEGERPVLDGQVPETPAEEVPPESVTKVGETITIVSKTFKPPGPVAPPEWCFKDFATPIPWIHVDIQTDPAGLPATADPDWPTEIKISVPEVPETAGTWPLKGEGNLKPPPGGGGGGGGGTKDYHWSAKISNEEVIFDPNPVKTGYALKDDGTLDPKKIKQTVTATFSPKALASNAKILVEDPNGRIESIAEGDLTRDAGAGTITFDVYGKTATPANQPNGDVTIKATKADDTPLKSEAKVIVVVPAGFKHPVADVTQNVNGANVILTPATKPPWCNPADQPPGAGFATRVAAVTQYLVSTTVQVLDQYGKPLADCYVDSTVDEKGLTAVNPQQFGWISSNQKIQAGGVYTDPIMHAMYLEGNQWLDPTHPDYQAGETWWLTQADKIPLDQQYNVNASKDVRIAGHELINKMGNRSYTAVPGPNQAPTATMIVTWP